MTLKMPRTLPFETQIIERYKRREAGVEEALSHARENIETNMTAPLQEVPEPLALGPRCGGCTGFEAPLPSHAHSQLHSVATRRLSSKIPARSSGNPADWSR